MSETLLEIEDLVVEFAGDTGLVHAVDELSLRIRPGEIVGLVGESGCGKSVTALALLGLVPSPPGRVSASRLMFDGLDLLQQSEAEMRRVRGAGIAMIFQEPMTALDPVFTVASQMTAVLRRLQRGEASDTLGDPTLLPRTMTRAGAFEVAGSFGGDFADALAVAPEGLWSGPVASTFGWHLVFVSERVPGSLPGLDEIREAVARDWAADQRREARTRFQAALRARYEIEVRLPDAAR